MMCMALRHRCKLTDKHLAIVMEYVNCGTLFDYVIERYVASKATVMCANEPCIVSAHEA